MALWPGRQLMVAIHTVMAPRTRLLSNPPAGLAAECRTEPISERDVCLPGPIYGAQVPTAEWRARRHDPKHHFAPVIDYHHNIVEHMAYMEEKGNYSSQKFPRKPELPR